jgi:uncharacterized protein YdeI (YjbR/CyaY-like superfamily)
MMPAGLAEYEKRSPDVTGLYSFEQDQVKFSPNQEKAFRKHRAAWKFFESQPPYYRRVITWWVISAKQEATRERRLQRLIDDSAKGQRTGSLASKPAGKP